jgi:hypothetical protein
MQCNLADCREKSFWTVKDNQRQQHKMGSHLSFGDSNGQVETALAGYIHAEPSVQP